MQSPASTFTTILVAMLLGGCVDATSDPAAVEAAASLYACVPVGSATGGADATSRRMVRIQVSPQQPLVLDFGNDRTQRLDPVGNSPGVFANSSYAWKAGRIRSRLTDIANIEAFDCVLSEVRR